MGVRKLLVGVQVLPGGSTCKDDDADGGCYYNSSGACRLFLRPDPQAGEADPTVDRWKTIILEDADAEGTCSKRCSECFRAEEQARSGAGADGLLDDVLEVVGACPQVQGMSLRGDVFEAVKRAFAGPRGVGGARRG